MGTALPDHAAVGSLTAAAAADEIVEAKQPGRGRVPVGPPTGCVRGVPEPEGPIAGCPELAFVTPAQQMTCTSLQQQGSC